MRIYSTDLTMLDHNAAFSSIFFLNNNFSSQKDSKDHEDMHIPSGGRNISDLPRSLDNLDGKRSFRRAKTHSEGNQ
jgi:hypothetical protein